MLSGDLSFIYLYILLKNTLCETSQLRHEHLDMERKPMNLLAAQQQLILNKLLRTELIAQTETWIFYYYYTCSPRGLGLWLCVWHNVLVSSRSLSISIYSLFAQWLTKRLNSQTMNIMICCRCCGIQVNAVIVINLPVMGVYRTTVARTKLCICSSYTIQMINISLWRQNGEPALKRRFNSETFTVQ